MRDLRSPVGSSTCVSDTPHPWLQEPEKPGAPGDPGELQARMEWALDHRDELGAMGVRAMKTGVRSIQDYAAEIEALYAELVEGG